MSISCNVVVPIIQCFPQVFEKTNSGTVVMNDTATHIFGQFYHSVLASWTVLIFHAVHEIPFGGHGESGRK